MIDAKHQIRFTHNIGSHKRTKLKRNLNLDYIQKKSDYSETGEKSEEEKKLNLKKTLQIQMDTTHQVKLGKG